MSAKTHWNMHCIQTTKGFIKKKKKKGSSACLLDAYFQCLSLNVKVNRCGIPSTVVHLLCLIDPELLLYSLNTVCLSKSEIRRGRNDFQIWWTAEKNKNFRTSPNLSLHMSYGTWNIRSGTCLPVFSSPFLAEAFCTAL
jgi:hypothetical protein